MDPIGDDAPRRAGSLEGDGHWFDRALDRLVSWMAVTSGVILFLMMFLVVVNTLTRKLFNAPVTGAFEVTESMLTLTVFLALAYTQRQHGHISVDVLSRHFSHGVKRVTNVFVPFLGVICFAWATYANWEFTLESYRIDEQEWGEITFPLWPVKGLMFVGLAILTLQFAVDTVKEWRAGTRGDR